jgi:hypothetical protein
MERLPVKSSNIKSIGRSENSIMEVEFSTGTVYQYKDLPKEVYDAFMNAESKGKFFATNIRPKYKGIKLEVYCQCGAAYYPTTDENRLCGRCNKPKKEENK